MRRKAQELQMTCSRTVNNPILKVLNGSKAHVFLQGIKNQAAYHTKLIIYQIPTNVLNIFIFYYPYAVINISLISQMTRLWLFEIKQLVQGSKLNKCQIQDSDQCSL